MEMTICATKADIEAAMNSHPGWRLVATQAPGGSWQYVEGVQPVCFLRSRNRGELVTAVRRVGRSGSFLLLARPVDGRQAKAA